MDIDQVQATVPGDGTAWPGDVSADLLSAGVIRLAIDLTSR